MVEGPAVLDRGLVVGVERVGGGRPLVGGPEVHRELPDGAGGLLALVKHGVVSVGVPVDRVGADGVPVVVGGGGQVDVLVEVEHVLLGHHVESEGVGFRRLVGRAPHLEGEIQGLLLPLGGDLAGDVDLGLGIAQVVVR